LHRGKHQTEAAKQEQERQEEERSAECKRRGFPKIGMTVDQATATCLGKPWHINRTQTRFGTHEQYVYTNFPYYLYFEDGILTSIQVNN
jgi:hypothetical protein